MSPRLFARLVSIEARKLMSYRVDFWMSTISSFLAEIAVAYYLWRAIFDASGAATIGGYRFDGMVLYYVAAILLGKVVRGQTNAMAVSQDIYEGTLTRYLVFPLPYFGAKYAEHLGSLVPGLVQLVGFGSIAALWLAPAGGTGISVGSAARCLLAVALANLLAFALRWPIQCAAFWADNVWSLNVMLRFVTDFLGGLLLPLSLFPDAFTKLLSYTPFPYFFYFPVTVLLGQTTDHAFWRGLMIMALWTAVLGVVGLVVWRRGQRTYTGVGI